MASLADFNHTRSLLEEQIAGPHTTAAASRCAVDRRQGPIIRVKLHVTDMYGSAVER